jgi:hypothetical protein
MACPPPEFDWSSWATWSCLREDLAPVLTFIGAAIVAGAALWQASTARRRHEEQTKADLERRITEAFAKAVEQLGSDKLEVRLGAVYALEDISRESERKYWPIMEVLTAYVRERAPLPPPQSDEAADQQKEPELSREKIPPKTDVQAVLTVLGRRDEEKRKQERDDQRLDLSQTDLRGANLTGAHLERANLWGAHLEHADFNEAHLEGTDLWGAHLEHAWLGRAHLEGAHIEKAHLEGVKLKETHLEGATFSEVYFENTKNLQEQINNAFGNENTILPGPVTAKLCKTAIWNIS